MSDSAPSPPRVFISYSHTSEKHVEWVIELAERLAADGVDVVLDQWSLRDGHELNSFMEQMVTDPTIKRVIVISDARYAAKANERKGGVGTESQIISQEVYKKVAQEKFVPIVRERDERGEPCLPVFLGARKYIDFSNAGDIEVYDQLLRNIFERPLRKKPAIGKPPSHIFEDDPVALGTVQKAKRFCDCVSTGRGNASAAFDDFTHAFTGDFEQLRLTYSRDQEGTWCATMMSDIERAAVHRNAFVDVARAGAFYIRDEWFVLALVSFLERLLPYRERPKQTGTYFRHSEDNYKFLLYELYLYVIAIFIAAKRFSDVRAMLEHQYISTQTLDSDQIETGTFHHFNNHAESLEQCTKDGNRLLSMMADLLCERATRSDIRLRDLMQADGICCLVSRQLHAYIGWFPRSFVYSGRVEHFELFLRAANELGLEPLKTLLRLDSAAAIIRFISSEEIMKLWNSEMFFRSTSPTSSSISMGWHKNGAFPSDAVPVAIAMCERRNRNVSFVRAAGKCVGGAVSLRICHFGRNQSPILHTKTSSTFAIINCQREPILITRQTFQQISRKLSLLSQTRLAG